MKELRLVRSIEADGVLARTRRAEIVAVAADGDDQRVVRNFPAWDQLPPSLVQGRRNEHATPLPVEAIHFAQLEAEMVPARLGQVIEGVLLEVHGAGRELVEQRLPQVRARAIDERDESLAAAPQLVPQARCELYAARAAPDDHDPMHCRPARRKRPPLVLRDRKSVSGMLERPGTPHRAQIGTRAMA